MTDISQEVLISNRRGLHARASAKFVTLASGLPAQITVTKDGSHAVTGTSIMGLMMLGAAMGDTITISATGTDAADSLARLITLVEDKFGED
ncbi:MAG: HPr family phosphocarrier protein [Sphingobium sp.]